MEKSDTITALATALALAQSKFEPVKRTETVDFSSASGRRRYNYAPLEEVISACRKALTENGLSVLQLTSKTIENKFLLETVLLHKSGEWIKSEMDVAAHPTDPQKQGSVLTYTRRYALSALLGVASEEDDDAQAATKPSTAGIEGKPAPRPATSGAEMMTQAQNSKLWVLAKEKGMDNVQVHALLTKTFPQHTSVTALTKVEAIKLIDLLEKMTSATETPSSAKAPIAVQQKSTIDLDWLKESLESLAWTDVLKYLKTTYKVTGIKVSEAVALLSPEQQREFAAEVEKRLKARQK